MVRYIIVFMLFFPLSWRTAAQVLTKTNVAQINLRSAGEIIHDGQVRGYFFFYNLEKKNANQNNYQLTVTDENLREINSIEITRPKSYGLVEAAFNGEAFGFLFFDSRASMIEIISYDETLTQLGTSTRKVTSRYAIGVYQQVVLGNEPSQAYLAPVEGGFLNYLIADAGDQHFLLECFDNNLKTRWREMAPARAKFEVASEGFQRLGFVGTLVTRKKSVSSKDINYDFMVHELNSGKQLFRVPVETSRYSMSISEVYYDSTKDHFIVFGEYFNKGDKEMRDDSQGFITLAFDRSGSVVGETINSWAKEISQATPMDVRGKFEGSRASVLFHNAVRTADGQIFLIGEQYKKVVSGAGVAVQALGLLAGYYGGAAAMQVNVYNMVIFEFNPDYTIKKVHLFEKSKSEITLPAGAGYSSPKFLSYYVKAIGGFDYAFTQVDRDQLTFSVSYIDFDRSKEMRQNVLGSIVYTPEKEFVVDKMPMSRKSTQFYVYKAKPGYVLVTEYQRKEKKFESRLEKINF